MVKTRGDDGMSINSENSNAEFNTNFQPNLPKNFSWQSDALCAQISPELFFPEKGGSTQAAKKICAQCEVGRECLDDALGRKDQSGIAGGFSPQERKKLLGEQRQEIDRLYEENRQKYRR